ncbi:N-acetyltransferase family protein [Paenibacillus sp. CMAA1364]
MINIREVMPDDATQLVKLNKQIDRETKIMLFEPGEREVDENQQRNNIISFLESENTNIFVAEFQDQLIGHLSVIGGNTSRIRHRAHIVIGLLNEFTGKGIGKELFKVMEVWLKTSCIRRLELTVMMNNNYGIRLYKRIGFEVEGII